jgi:hypothetical protein
VSAPLPSVGPRAGQLRAFEILDRVPHGCFAIQVTDERHTPHLAYREMAIIDPTDREYQCGELFALQQSNGPVIWEVRPFPQKGLLSDEPCLHLLSLNRPRSFEEADRLMKAGLPVHMCDGPLRMSAWPEMVIGRVIGVWDPMAQYRRPV